MLKKGYKRVKQAEGRVFCLNMPAAASGVEIALMSDGFQQGRFPGAVFPHEIGGAAAEVHLMQTSDGGGGKGVAVEITDVFPQQGRFKKHFIYRLLGAWVYYNGIGDTYPYI